MKHYNTIRNWLYSNKKTYEWLGNRIGRSESYNRILDLMGKDNEDFTNVFTREELVK